MEDQTREVLDILSNIHIFHELDEDQLEDIAENLDTLLIQEGQFIFTEGDPADGFYIIISGRISIQRGMAEDAHEVSIFQRGDYFGEEGLVTNQFRQVNAFALTNVVLLRLSNDIIDDLAEQYPQIVAPIRLTLNSYHLFLKKDFSWRTPREAVQFIARKHHFFLFSKEIPPLLFGLITIIPVTFLYLTVSQRSFFVLIILMLNILVFFGWIIWQAIDWSNDYAIITNRRVVSLEKIYLLYESRQEAPLDAVLSVETKTTQLGRMLGYGDVVMRTFTGYIIFKGLARAGLIVRLINEERQRASERTHQAQRYDKEDTIREMIGARKIEHDPFCERVNPESAKMQEAPRRLTSGKLSHWLATFFRLREEENGIITYRTHWYILLKRVIAPSATLFLLFFLFLLTLFRVFTLFSLKDTLVFYIATGLVLLLWWGYQYWDWRNDRYIIGHDQLIDLYRKPLGQEQKRTAPIKNIQTVEFERLGLMSLILNFGTVFIRVGDTSFSFDYVFNPSEVQKEIFERYQEYIQAQKDREQENMRKEMAEWIEIYHQVVQNGGTPPPPPYDDEISGYNIDRNK